MTKAQGACTTFAPISRKRQAGVKPKTPSKLEKTRDYHLLQAIWQCSAGQ
ncbi:hypothetical protein [Extensimonas vulgaris]|nr:hypothetical protein [Extensimonas vulgaris]